MEPSTDVGVWHWLTPPLRRTPALRQKRHSITVHYANRGGQPSISNIGLQLRESLLIVDQLRGFNHYRAGAKFRISRKRKGSIGKHLPAWDEKAMQINARTWRNW